MIKDLYIVVTNNQGEPHEPCHFLNGVFMPVDDLGCDDKGDIIEPPTPFPIQIPIYTAEEAGRLIQESDLNRLRGKLGYTYHFPVIAIPIYSPSTTAK